jgi:hypothetical protein
MKKHFVLIIVCLVTGALFFNCNSTSNAPEIAADVNPDKPIRGDWDLKAEKVWEISQLNGKPIASPMITVSEDETTYIYDNKLSLTFIFNRDGKLKTSFGKKGKGPGEVVNTAFFYPVDDKFYIFDFPIRLHLFNKDGEFIKFRKINMQNMPYSFINENEYISCPPPGFDEAKIKYINLKTGKEVVIKEITYNAPVIKRGDRTIIVAEPGLTGLMKLCFDKTSRRIYYGINDKYQVNIADLKGNIIKAFAVDRKKRTVSKEKKRQVLSARLRGLAEQVSDPSMKLLPDEITFFHKIQIVDGLLYVFQDNFGANWESQQLDIFSLEGEYLYRAVFRPDAGETIYKSSNYGDNMYIRRGHLYLSLETDKGVIKVAKYKLRLPTME